MLRFSIRDVLWLTLVVAVAVAWQIQHQRDLEKAQEDRRALLIQLQGMKSERDTALIVKEELKGHLNALRESNAAFETQLKGLAQGGKP